MRCVWAIAVAALVSPAPPAAADADKVYMGIKPLELAEFLGRAG